MAFDANKKAQKWARRMADAQQDYKDGIMAYDGNPGAEAAAHSKDARANYVARIDDGTWAKKVSSVQPADWKKAATDIGAPRLVDGVKKGQPKVTAYLTAAGGDYDNIKKTIRAMPKGTEAERRARRDKAELMMKALKGKGRY